MCGTPNCLCDEPEPEEEQEPPPAIVAHIPIAVVNLTTRAEVREALGHSAIAEAVLAPLVPCKLCQRPTPATLGVCLTCQFPPGDM